MGTIPMYIESSRGHDTLEVPNNPPEIQKAVETQLKDDKWVTVENQDGSSELLTESDIPSEDEDEEEELDDEDKKLMGDWQGAFKTDKPSPSKPKPVMNNVNQEQWESKFKDVKSACATNKSKGG